MFITHENGRQQFASGLFGPGIDSWNYMTIDIWVPWFIVTVDTADEDGDVWSSSMCLHRVRQLEELIQDSDSTIVRLHLISPTEEHPKGWQMDEVSDLNCCVLDANDPCVYELVLVSGQSTWLPLGSADSIPSQVISRRELWKR